MSSLHVGITRRARRYAYNSFLFSCSSGFDVTQIASALPPNLQQEVVMFVHEDLVRQAAADEAMIEEAAGQIADEQGLSEEEEYALIQKMRANLRHKAAAIEQKASARQSESYRRQLEAWEPEDARAWDRAVEQIEKLNLLVLKANHLIGGLNRAAQQEAKAPAPRRRAPAPELAQPGKRARRGAAPVASGGGGWGAHTEIALG